MKIGSDYKKSVTKEEAFERFLLKKKSINLAQKTIDGYEYGWETFLKFERYKKANFKFEDINEDLLTEYRVFLTEHTNANEVTRATYVKNLRTILRDFMAEGYIDEPFKVIIPKYSTPVQSTYTINELQLIMKKPSMDRKRFNFVEYRTWVMICYIIDTTNRADTVLNLKIKDIDFEYRKLTLQRVKSKRPYTAPLSTFLILVLKEYLSIRKGEPEDYVFCTHTGKPFKYEGFRSALIRYNRKRGVDKTGIHELRHTASKLFILNGGREFTLMELLGHTDVSMSKKYVAIYSDDLNEGFDEKCGLSKFSNVIMPDKKINFKPKG